MSNRGLRPANFAVLAAALVLGARPSWSAVMTVDDAVKIALQHNTLVIGADAGVLDAKSGLYGAYSGILPHASASLSRSSTVVDNQTGGRNIGGGLTAPLTSDFESHGTTPGLNGTWNVLNLSSIEGFRSASSSLKAAKLSRTATRNDVILETRRQFYTTVSTYHLARVAAGALRVARDNERRSSALFEVGSVSKSDLLKAQVRTAQSELDSITAAQAIVNSRIALASQIGIRESELGDIDTVLTVTPQEFDEAELYKEAAAKRPDLMAAEADLASAKSQESSAHFNRLPYVSMQGGVTFNTKDHQTSTIDPPGLPGIPPGIESTSSQTDRQFQGSIALNWNFFDGLSTDSRNAAARARVRRSTETYDALQRNLESEVHQAVIAYREAVERDRVASRAFESAVENLKLIQQKYNVGSATILDLVDAQEQATQAAVDGVSARAQIRIAEATIDRVRGRGE